MTTHDGRSRSRQVERIGAATLVALVLCLGGAVAGAQGRDIEPVTDAMLQNPDPADWLNWRRTLDGWGYSRSTRSTGRTSTGCNSSGAGSSVFIHESRVARYEIGS